MKITIQPPGWDKPSGFRHVEAGDNIRGLRIVSVEIYSDLELRKLLQNPEANRWVFDQLIPAMHIPGV